MSDKISVVFHSRPYTIIKPVEYGIIDKQGMSSFTKIPERIFQIEFGKINGQQSCIIWDKMSYKKVRFLDIKSQREQFWSTLSESTNLEEKVAYWIVELYKQSADSMLEEIQETVKLFVEVLRAIRDDNTVMTPKTMDVPVSFQKDDYFETTEIKHFEQDGILSIDSDRNSIKTIIDIIAE